LTFAYDAGGLRIRKGATTYQLDGSRILSETRPTGTVWYYYDNGGICGFKYNNVRYYYEKNLQGDITAIYDGNGNKKAEYQYDAWGNHTITVNIDGIAILNPFRYRGYYFDTETGMYYLNSRYYDPQTGRFINADKFTSTGQGFIGFNMFAYCNNSPILFIDSTGNMAITPKLNMSAVELLLIWLIGNGNYVKFGENSTLAESLKNSSHMNDIIDDCIETFKTTGQANFSGNSAFSGLPELDLWLGVRGFRYEINITEKTYTVGFGIFKKQYTEYTAEVRIWDTYDFNSNQDSGDGIGSILNNIAYNLHEKGVGSDYGWEVSYSQKIGGKRHNYDFFVFLL